MGVGSPPREDRIKAPNGFRFFVAMLVLWTVAHALILGLSGTAWMLVIIAGVVFGYPMIAVVGLLEYLSSRITTGLPARLLFVFLAATLFYAVLYFTTKVKISEHPDMWYSYFRENILVFGPGTLLVVVGYLVHGFRRDQVMNRSQAS